MLPFSLEARLIAFALAAAALLGGFAWFVHHEREKGAETVRAAVQAVGAAQAASSAIESARLQSATQETVHVAQVQLQAASAAAAGAARERDAARMQLNAYLRSRTVPSGAQAASGSAPAADPDVLLAGLLNAAWDRSVELAAESDKRGVAGSACERFGDSVSK